MNTTEEVATKLVDYCRKGEWMKAAGRSLCKRHRAAWSRARWKICRQKCVDLIKCVEKPIGGRKISKCTARRSAGRLWPGIRFVVQFDVDVTEKASKKRMQMSEVGIYKVKDGKVAHEQFLPLAQKKE